MKPKVLVIQKTNSELTIEKLRTYKGFECISDDEAILHIQNIKALAKILFGIFRENNQPRNARK